LCPYTLTKKYLKYLGASYQGYLQPSCLKGNPDVANPKKPMGYNCAHANLREVLDLLGYCGADYGEHSAKRGMATHCSKLGIPEPEIQVAGNWTNLKTTRLYIDKKAVKTQNFINSVI